MKLEELTRESLPLYRSHKVVGALKIREIEKLTNPLDESQTHRLHFEDPNYPAVEVSLEWIMNRSVAEGGYLVIYRDGYASWSPALEFEDGYTPEHNLDEEENPA